MYRKIAAALVLVLVTGCAGAQYGAAIDAYNIRAVQCVKSHGGTTDYLGSVPKENIVAATNCVNHAEQETLIPIYDQWGYSSASTYQGQALMLELARLRENDKISAEMFHLQMKKIFALEEEDLRQQDDVKRAAWQDMNNQLLLEQTLGAQRAAAEAQQSAAMQSTMPHTVNTHCRQTGRSINCTSQ